MSIELDTQTRKALAQRIKNQGRVVIDPGIPDTEGYTDYYEINYEALLREIDEFAATFKPAGRT